MPFHRMTANGRYPGYVCLRDGYRGSQVNSKSNAISGGRRRSPAGDHSLFVRDRQVSLSCNIPAPQGDIVPRSRRGPTQRRVEEIVSWLPIQGRIQLSPAIVRVEIVISAMVVSDIDVEIADGCRFEIVRDE